MLLTELLTWGNFFGIMVALACVCALADKLGWWE